MTNDKRQFYSDHDKPDDGRLELLRPEENAVAVIKTASSMNCLTKRCMDLENREKASASTQGVRQTEAKGLTPQTFWTARGGWHTQDCEEGADRALSMARTYSNTPKPPSLIRRMLEIANGQIRTSFLIFSPGPGRLAQAVLDLNRADGGQRRFILVQLPEPNRQLKGLSNNCRS